MMQSPIRLFHQIGLVFALTKLAIVVASEIEKFEEYEKWLVQERGYTIGSVKILEDSTGYRRMVATDAIKDNFLLVKLPIASAWTEETVKLTVKDLGCGDEKIEDLDPRARLVATILREKQNPESPWKPMFDLHPKEFDVPISWSTTDLTLLRGSGQQLEVLKQRDIFSKEYKGIVTHCPEFGDQFSYDDFLQAGSAAASIGLGDEAIVPYLEFVNHDDKPNAEVAQVEDEGVIALVSTRDIRAGEEIVMSYYQDQGADLSAFSNFGFLSEKPVATGVAIMPACIPPSVVEVMEATGTEEMPGITPLKPCCEDSGGDDEFCFGSHVREPQSHNSFPFDLGPIKPDGTQGAQKEDARSVNELLHRLRTLHVDAGGAKKCTAEDLELTKPVSMETEVAVMRLLKSLLSAHLAETRWAMGENSPPAPADAAAGQHIDIVRKALRIERGVFEWYIAAADFAEEHLLLPNAKTLQERLCKEFMQKGKAKAISKYAWLVEYVLAPLAFRPRLENGESCSVEQATYKMKAKECKDVLARSETGHGGEL